MSHRLVPLSNGLNAKVDEADFTSVSGYRWHGMLCRTSQTYYAVRLVRSGGRRTTISMARQIAGLKCGDGRVVDHINHDTLDNRRTNIRVCSRSENMRNRRKFANTKNPAKGVHLSKWGTGYDVRITLNRKNIYLGHRKTISEAVDLRREGERKYHGDFAYLAGTSVVE